MTNAYIKMRKHNFGYMVVHSIILYMSESYFIVLFCIYIFNVINIFIEIYKEYI